MVNTLEKEYSLLAEQGVEREKEKVKIGAAEKTRQSIRDTLLTNVGKYTDLATSALESGNLNFMQEEYVRNFLKGGVMTGDTWTSFSDMDAQALQEELATLQDMLGNGIWDEDQSFLSPEEAEKLVKEYNQAGDEISKANEAIRGINDEMAKTKDSISTTEKAVNSVTAELNADATGVSEAGANLVNAINTAASSIGGEDGSHAIGSPYIPYDDYYAKLHRGEMVLTATQARDYRQGGSADVSGLEDRIASAIRAGMEGATVRSFLNGRDITREVNRENINNVKGRRFRG